MADDRERFAAEELATCLSHYRLGTITSIQEFLRGSGSAPKVIVESSRGKFLFKRRAKGKDDPARVAFTHQIQLALAEQNFPLAHLIGTRRENNSMLVLDSRIYELFEFVEGGEYDGSGQATHDAGRILGLYHRLLEHFRGDYPAPVGSYHGAAAVRQAIGDTAASLPASTPPSAQTVQKTIDFLGEAYQRCAREADSLGLSSWGRQIVHGDWHPGNMLFKDQRVAAVIDYDSARLQRPAIDLANGALQFSIIGGGDDPLQWPHQVDQARFRQFTRGYDSANVISKRELQALPYLMCEAMIAEAVLPIAATGSFGRIEGLAFLQMIEKKVRWILDHLADLQAVPEG